MFLYFDQWLSQRVEQSVAAPATGNIIVSLQLPTWGAVHPCVSSLVLCSLSVCLSLFTSSERFSNAKKLRERKIKNEEDAFNYFTYPPIKKPDWQRPFKVTEHKGEADAPVAHLSLSAFHGESVKPCGVGGSGRREPHPTLRPLPRDNCFWTGLSPSQRIFAPAEASCFLEPRNIVLLVLRGLGSVGGNLHTNLECHLAVWELPGCKRPLLLPVY